MFRAMVYLSTNDVYHYTQLARLSPVDSVSSASVQASHEHQQVTAAGAGYAGSPLRRRARRRLRMELAQPGGHRPHRHEPKQHLQADWAGTQRATRRDHRALDEADG